MKNQRAQSVCNRLWLPLLALLAFSSTATAQGVSFNATSLPRLIRSQGITEVVGELVLTAANAGTIAAGSVIFIDYGAAITNNSTLSTTNIAVANNLFCNGSGLGSPCPADWSLSIDNATTLRLFFNNQSALLPGDTINISRVRVDASAVVTDSLRASIYMLGSDQVNRPLSVSSPERLVGILNSAITADFNHGTATPNPVTPFLTCSFPNDATNDFFVRVNEGPSGALSTQAQEAILSPNLAPTNGANITITITNVPAGLTLSATGTQLTFGSLLMAPATPATSVDQTVPGAPITFTYQVLASDINNFDRTTFSFSLKPTTVSTANPLPIANVASPINIQGIVQITPITSSDSTIVRFADNQIGPVTLATINNCPTPRAKGPQLISE